MAAGITLTVLLLVGWLAITAPLSKSLEPIAPPQITLLAADGTPIARNGAVVEAPVKIAALPDHVVQSFLAIEDRRFYSHWGLDARGLVRAAWTNLTTGRTQGGSTITQQLAKFTFLTPERSLTRKAREALIAFWLEIWLTKDEILERYLSNAYFGDNTYGLRAASLHYFSRAPEKLSPGQAAMLAGLVQAPSRLAPTSNYGKARERMQLVLKARVAVGNLTDEEARAVAPPRLAVGRRSVLPTGTYFADWALPQARKLSEVGYSRQTIATTLDARLQAAARRATSRVRGTAQVALVAMRTNGEVVAMVGGTDYQASPFNRATQARRQPGSTFKPFVYLAALQEGWKPSDRISNQPITSGSYRPKNFGGVYSDTIALEDAFARSSNVAAVRLFDKVGDRAVIDTAHALGIVSPLAAGDPSLSLGTSSVTLLELTAAYAGIAANRFPVVPRPFKVEPKGWLARLFDGQDRLSSDVHDDIEAMLRRVVSQGTGRAAALSVPAYGKSGTSQESRDALFVGYAGDLVVGVWVGRDDNTPLVGVSGGGLPARIWRDFMTQALGKRADRPHRANPRGPVQPQDAPTDAEAVPGNRAAIWMDGAGVLGGKIGNITINVDDPKLAEELARLAQDGKTIVQRARTEQQRAGDAARRAMEQAGATSGQPQARPTSPAD
ncbi:transglycosylase domain-containing protein [Novosphingobium sp. PS1R-30]|uniref:peptidoglycan glycosyltransferase n=1 Tax=Novosphingobium anseongense TaxID=3133436 RepID=A0ABU8S118_9SPHN